MFEANLRVLLEVAAGDGADELLGQFDHFLLATCNTVRIHEYLIALNHCVPIG